jgi:hypothetical protein
MILQPSQPGEPEKEAVEQRVKYLLSSLCAKLHALLLKNTRV